MPIRWPLLAVRPDAHCALIERAKEIVRERAARIVRWPVEVDERVAPGWLHVDAWLTCDASNLKSVQSALAPDLEIGEEVAVDLWSPGERVAALLGLDPTQWQAFQRETLVDLRAAFEQEHRLLTDIHSAWLNIDYSERMNARAPDLNESAPGRPYFDGTEPLLSGQWLRIVVKFGPHSTFWGIAHVVDGEQDEVRFRDLGYEGGADSVNESARSRVTSFHALAGVARRAADGIWDVVSLSPAELGSQTS